jgi:hypothetical protein
MIENEINLNDYSGDSCSSDVYIATGRLMSIKDTDKKLDEIVKEANRQNFLDGIKNSVEKLFIRRPVK